MEKRHEETFQCRDSTDGGLAHEKILSTIGYQKMQNKPTMRCHSTTTRTAKISSRDSIEF